MVATKSRGMSPRELEIMRAVEDDFWWYRALRGHVLNCLSAIPLPFKLLDAGCGSGGMLARVHERFPRAELMGIDTSARAIELTAQRRTDARLVQGSVNELPFGSGEFDVVLSLDVIYHRDVDDRAALREMHRVLRDGGKLIVNVPAFEFLRGSHDVAVDGVRRYRRTALAAQLSAAGFSIENLSYWNMMLFPAVAFARALSRRKAHDANLHSDLVPLPRLLNGILAAITQSELALSRRVPLPFGTSLFAIARK